MTTTATPRFALSFKVGKPEFDENEHPRDRKGRFIETGAEVRIWGGQLGKVLRNVGGGKIEVERQDGKKVIVHRNYLTVTARPNGEAPTTNEAETDAAPVEAASPDAEVDPNLADGADVALPDRGAAPDHLVENPTMGEQVGDYTVGEYVDGPAAIDGWVVGVTDSGGPIVRTEDGKDWPLLPDAQIARDDTSAPDMPEGLIAGDQQAAPSPDAPQANAPEGQQIDSVNPSSSGVFEDYASGREFRANAPLAPNMTTLAETEGHDPEDEVTLYRGVAEGDPKDGIQPGDFVTTNRQLAQDYAGTGDVVEMTAKYGDVIDDRDEPGGEEYIYRPRADAAPETQAPEQQTPDAPEKPQEPTQAPEQPTPATGAPSEPAQAPETPGTDAQQSPDAPAAPDPLADRAYQTLSSSPEAEGMSEESVRSLIDQRLRETGGEPFTDVVIGEHGVRIFRGEDRVEPFNVEDLAGGPEALPDALRPRGDAAIGPGVSPERQHMIDAVEAGASEEGVNESQRRRIMALADVLRGDAVTDEQARTMLDAVAATDAPGMRTIRERLDAPAAAAPAAAPNPGEDDAPAPNIEYREAVSFRAGYEAMLNDEPRAPALNPTVMDLIDPDSQPGDENTMRIMTAFTRGYSKAIDDEMAGHVVLPEMPDEEGDDLPDGVIGAAPSKGRTTKITLPDGQVATRSSKSRAYTHVVVSEPATQEARTAAFNRRADALEARADVLDAAVADNVAKKRGRGLGGREDENYFHSHEAWLVGTELPARDTRGRSSTYPEIQTRTNLNGEVVVYGDVPEGVDVVRETPDGQKVVEARPYLLAMARQKADSNREEAARLREEGAKPDEGGYGVLRWTSSADLGRKAAEGELSYDAVNYGRRIRVLPVDPDVDEVDVDPERANADLIARRAADEAGLDSSRIKLQGNLYVSTAAALNVGDVVYTRDDSSLSPARGSLAPQDKRQRTIARFGYDTENRTRTIEFTDGTSTVKPSGGTRVAHVPVSQRTPEGEATVPEVHPDAEALARSITRIEQAGDVWDSLSDEERADRNQRATRVLALGAGASPEEQANAWIGDDAVSNPERRDMVARFEQHAANTVINATVRAGDLDEGDRVVIDGRPATVERIGTDQIVSGLSHGDNVMLDGTFDDGSNLHREFPRDTTFERVTTPAPQPDGERAQVFANPADGDEVTISVPGARGINHNIFTYRESTGRWHQGTIDANGLSEDQLWNAYVRVRDDNQATIRRGGAPSPFGNGATLPGGSGPDRPTGGPQDVQETPNGQYRVGQVVEVQTRDFSAPGQPQVWRRGTIGRITLDPDTNLSTIITNDEDGRLLPTQTVGPRGGNQSIRAVEDNPDEGDELVPDAGAPKMATPRAAADFINAATVGEADPEMRDSIQAALNPTTRAVNGIYGADGMRNIERHPDADRILPFVLTARAGITTRDGRRVWDGERAQIALNRLLSGDETLPANSVGKRASIEVLDMDAPIVLGQPAATKRVEGRVDSIVEGTSPGLFLRIIDDNGEPHVQAMRPDATVEILPDREPEPEPTPERAAPKEVAAPNGSIRYGRRPEDLQPGDRVHTSGGSLMEERFVQTEPTASAAPQGGGQVYPFGNQIRTVDRIEGDRVYFVTDENFIGGQQRYASINTFRLQRDAMGRTSPDKTVMIEHDVDAPQPGPDPTPQPGPDPEPEPAPTPSPEPRGPFTLGEGTAVEGDVIVNTRTGGAVQLTSVSRQSVGLTSFDGYTQANPLYGDGDLDRLLASYRPANDEEAATFRQRLAVARGEVDPASLPEVTTTSVSAGDVAIGQTVIFEDGTIATIEDKNDADGLVELEYRDSNGLAGSYFVDPSTSLQVVDTADGSPPPPPSAEPDENPEASLDRTAQVTAQNLVPGDAVWAGTTGRVVVTAIEPNDVDTMMVTFQKPDRTTFTTPMGREAVLDRADDPFLPDSSPLPPDTATSRPALYTYQRRNIVALGLDTDVDPMVAEAARRIRLRQPLAAAHSAALAQRLVDLSASRGVKPQRQRMLLRLAAANNAASIEAGGRGVDLPEMPNAGTVTKARPADVGVGDQIAFVGLRGAIAQGRITNVRRMMSGRLTEVTYSDPEGNERTTMLTRNTDVFVLPDLPEPTPVPQSTDAPELVQYGDLRVGDRIRIPRTHDLFSEEGALTEATVVEAGQSEGNAYAVLNVHDVMSNDPEQRMVLSIDPRMQGLPPQVIRVERGAESADQPRETNLPPFDPTEVPVTEVGVGDWIATANRNVGTTDGIVVDSQVLNGEDGQRIGQRFQLRRPGDNFGSTTWVTVMDGDETTVTRLVANDQNTILRVAEEKRKRARVAREQAVARDIERVLDDYNSGMHFRVVQNALHGGSIADEHYGQAIHAAFIGGQDPTTSLDDDRMRAIRNLTRSLQGHLSGEHADEPGFNGVRDAAWRLAEQIVNDHNSRVFTAMMNVRPTEPGGSQTEAGIALARSIFRPESWGVPAMEQRDLNALARGVVNAREAREAADTGGTTDLSVPDMPEGTSLRDRMAAYRKGLSTRFGFTDSTVTTFGDFDLDSLERGEVPELTTANARAKDRATDGGPGASTMAQLDTLKAAGADLGNAIDQRIAAEHPDLTTEAYDALYNEKVQAQKRYEIASETRNTEYKDAQTRAARELGYVNWNQIQQMLYRRQDLPEGKTYDEVRADYSAITEATRADATFKAADEASNEAYRNYQTLEQHLRDMRARIAEARAKATRSVLSEVRDMGSKTPLSYRSAGRRDYESGRPELRSGETMKAMRYAETNYPSDWLDALNSSPKGALQIGAAKRGYFQSSNWIIRLSKDDNRNNESGWVPPRGRVATHELGHAMEVTIPGLSQAEEAFLWARTSQGEVGSRMRGKTKRIDSSTSYLDEFKESYSGKDYADGNHYELFTTGMESLFAGSDYVDPDYRNWLLGVLALL